MALLQNISRSGLLRRMIMCTCAKRKLTTERGNYVSVEEDPLIEGLAIMKMRNGPVNAFKKDFLLELGHALDNLENNETKRAVIFTSDFPSVFSAGADLFSMYGKSYEEIYPFVKVFDETLFKLYKSPLIIFAAINGSAIAGGCAIAVICDYRIMADGKSVIGLNEIKLGIDPSAWFGSFVKDVVGNRQAESLLQTGDLLTPNEALKIGLVDEVVPADQVMDRAKTQIQKWLAVPDMPRSTCKQSLRKEMIDMHYAVQEEQCKSIAKMIAGQRTQRIMGNYVNSLKKNR